MKNKYLVAASALLLLILAFGTGFGYGYYFYQFTPPPEVPIAPYSSFNDLPEFTRSCIADKISPGLLKKWQDPKFVPSEKDLQEGDQAQECFRELSEKLFNS